MWSTSRSGRTVWSYLLFLTVVACVCVVYFSVTLSGKHSKTNAASISLSLGEIGKLTDERCLPICDSPECIFQANMLLKNIKSTMNPCNNYAEFLCGSYKEKMGPDSVDSVVYETTMILKRRLRDILENIQPKPGSAADKMKIVYDSCINLGSSQLRGVRDLQQFLNDVGITNWPTLSPEYKFSDKDLPALLGFFTAYRMYTGFGFILGDGQDYKALYDYVQVLPNAFLMKTLEKDVAADILSYFDIETEEIEMILEDHLTVTETFLNVSEDSDSYCEENCDVHVNCSTTDEEDWEFICKIVESYLNVTELKEYVSSNDIVLSQSSIFFYKQLVPRLRLLPDRSFANFFALSTLWNNVDQLNFFFLLKKKKHFKFFQSEESKSFGIGNRWSKCISWLTGKMKLPLEQEYTKHYLTSTSLEEILEMHNDSVTRVADMIADQEWISSKPRPFIQSYIRSLKSNIMYLKEKLSNENYAEDFFKVFRPVKTSFFRNVLEHHKTMMNAHLRFKLGQRTIEADFKVNAASHELRDFSGIVLHYGYLMPPFFYPGFKKSVNRIMLTRSIYHEIGHVVINQLDAGSTYFGRIRRGLTERKNCIINQFSQYKFQILDEHLNGTQYCEENLADNLGYMFLDKIIRDINPSEAYLLPGLSYSQKQLFYMLAGQNFCQASNLKLEIQHKTVDPHAPSEYRLIGTAQNSNGFSEAFKCPEGSYMNPAIKCSFLDVM